MAEDKAGDKAAKAPENPLAAAADRIRESAKWMLTSFAAVGVVFAAGLQLADLGELSTDEPGRLVAAGIGLLATVVSITVAVAAAGSVAATSHVNLILLAHDDDFAKVRESINSDTVLLQPAADVAALEAQVTDATVEANARYDSWREAEARSAPEPEIATAREHAEAAAAEAKRWLAARDRTLSVASFLRVKYAYEWARKRIGFAAFGAAIGLILFAWGANAPAEPQVDAGEILPKAPSEVSVVFTDTGRSQARKALGKKCDLGNVAAVAFDVSGETYQVATVKTKKCAAAWLAITPEIGAVVARIAPASGEAGKASGS